MADVQLASLSVGGQFLPVQVTVCMCIICIQTPSSLEGLYVIFAYKPPHH